MLRSLLCACLALGIFGLVVVAGEYQGIISKVDPDKGTVTFYTFKFDPDTKKGEKGDEKTLPVSKDLKVYSARFDKETKKLEKGDEIKEGLKADAFTAKGGKFGTFGTIITDKDDKTVTEIHIATFKGGKGDKGDKDKGDKGDK